jgi:eukaryotic-like serine/threonine-protein kinase
MSTKSSGALELLEMKARPRTVGKYRILAELGRGGMATVFLAVIRGPGGIGKLVVLKALLPELASDPQALAMFLDEARLGTQLNHSNVVQTYEVGTEGDRHVIVMEYLAGQSLSTVLQKAATAGTPLRPEHYLHVLLGVLDGLHYAHELRGLDGAAMTLVHRDVSPQNTLICYDGQVKVLDFGIAKVANSTTDTATGLLKGKMSYMAPEQMAGSELDRRADIFAVGCMLWGMAAGRKLWKDTPNVKIFRRVMDGEIPSPKTVNSACDPELERIVMKALAHDPDKRYSTALELHDELLRYGQRFEIPRAKDVGAFVSSLFREQRQELKSLLEKQLSALNAGTDFLLAPDLTTTGTRATRATTVDVPRTQITSASSSGSSSARSLRRKLRKSNKGIVVAAALLVAGAAVWLQFQPPVGAAATSAWSPAPSQHPPLEAAPTLASITFEATPKDATFMVDNQALPGNPAVKSFRRDGEVHRVTVVAKDYVSAEQEFTVQGDAKISLDLLKVESSSASAKRSSSKGKHAAAAVVVPVRPAAVTPAKPATPSNGPDCSNPMFIDTSGIRRIKPGCL